MVAARCWCPILIASIFLIGAPMSAQDAERPLPAVQIIKQVGSDPTTYAPAVISVEALHLDWSSSQVFFQHGFLESNPRFTISGRPNDVPIGFGDGNAKILKIALATLRMSLVNNTASAIVEGLAIRRFPEHRKLVRTLGWIERVSLATYWSHHESFQYFRQWQRNEETARQLGYK